MILGDFPSVPTRIGPHSNGMLLTPVEYDAIEDWEEGFRYELVHGVLIVNPPAGAGERSPNDELGYLIRLFKDTHANGTLVDETLPEQEVCTAQNRRRADRAVWLELGRKPKPDEDVPTIAVEFVSASSRDRRRDDLEKRQEYLAAGVREYWVIDRFRRRMTVFRAADQTQVVNAGEVYQTALLPGFELPLDRLLAAADAYNDPAS